MSVVSKKYKLHYVSVPKVACTSLKVFFFELENGFEFTPFRANGKLFNIHRLYRPEPVNASLLSNTIGMKRIAFVREPVQRFLSAYSNRVIHHRDMDNAQTLKPLAKKGLDPIPNIHTFIDNFEHYSDYSKPIQHHTKPLTHFLGTDPSIYDRIFKLSEMKDFEQYIYELTGLKLTVPHLQTGGPKIKADVLSKSELSKISSIYQQDYSVFSEYF